MVSPLLVKELQQYGQTVKTFEPRVLRERIASPATIALVQECLKGVATEGTARRLQIQGMEIAVKTGTAQIPNYNRGYGAYGDMNYLATLVGYFPADDPKYTCIVSIKTYTGQGRGANYYGGSLAGPVFRSIVERVYGSAVEWNPPVAEQFTAQTDDLPDVKAGQQREVRRVLDRLDIPYQAAGRAGDTWTAVERDSTGMHLAVLEPADPETIPDVTGMGLQDAVRLLEQRGLRVTFTGKGAVTRQSPAAGEPIRPGQEIQLTLR